MKKLVALLLAVILVMGCMSAVAEVDLTMARENTKIFNISVNADDDCAFVSSTYEIKDLSFTHKYESSDYYSYTSNDMIVLNYFESNSYAVWRMWIEYVGTKNIYANSVSFIFNGKDYRFSGITRDDSFGKKDNGDVTETYCIVFGTTNSDFIIDMETYFNQLTDGEESVLQAVLAKSDIRMVLHGAEDLEVKLPGQFLIDEWIVSRAFLNCSDSVVTMLGKAANPTTLKVTTAPAASQN